MRTQAKEETGMKMGEKKKKEFGDIWEITNWEKDNLKARQWYDSQRHHVGGVKMELSSVWDLKKEPNSMIYSNLTHGYKLSILRFKNKDNPGKCQLKNRLRKKSLRSTEKCMRNWKASS